MSDARSLPDLISTAQTSEEAFLRQIFVRDQMAEWSKSPLIMERADGVFYWDTDGNRYYDAISGIYVAAIRPPTVPPGTSRLRVSLMATHTEEQIRRAADAIIAAVNT